MTEYPWPGNVRELRNTLERIILLEDDGSLTADHLSSLMPEDEPSRSLSTPEPSPSGLDYDETIKALMHEALARTHGNVVEASRMLNMPAHKMRYRMKKYGIKS